MGNNSFCEKLLNFSHFSSQIQKMFTFTILATAFSQITNMKIQTCFTFQVQHGLKASTVLSKF